MIVIKFFGIGSIVRVANVLKDADFPSARIELITLKKNEPTCNLLGIKGHYIRSKKPFSMLLDLLGVLFLVWRMKNVTIVDLERTSNLSGIFRLMCTIGKSCSSFTFDTKNSESRNQSFISLKNKAATLALAEIFKAAKKPAQNSKKTPRGNTIVLNINAGEYLPQRKYPINYFVEIINGLKKENDSFQFTLTGSNNEKAYTNLLAAQLDKIGITYKNTAGELSLIELTLLLKNSRMLITNDSGPMHLAYYYEVPTIAIWGPTSAQLVGYPDSYRMKNVSIEKGCSPCFIHPKSKVAQACSNRIDCFQELSPKKVLNAIFEIYQPINTIEESVR